MMNLIKNPFEWLLLYYANIILLYQHQIPFILFHRLFKNNLGFEDLYMYNSFK